jgi:hypothetical protein
LCFLELSLGASHAARGMLTAEPPKLEAIMRRLSTRNGDATTLRRPAFLSVAPLLMIIVFKINNTVGLWTTDLAATGPR